MTYLIAKDWDLPTILAMLHELPLEYAPLNTDVSDRLWGAEQGSEALIQASPRP